MQNRASLPPPRRLVDAQTAAMASPHKHPRDHLSSHGCWVLPIANENRLVVADALGQGRDRAGRGAARDAFGLYRCLPLIYGSAAVSARVKRAGPRGYGGRSRGCGFCVKTAW
jgi:hypothetical protein